METIEIRQNRKPLIPFLALWIASSIGVIYFIYFSGMSNITTMVFYFLINAFLIYNTYIPLKKFFQNLPILKLNNSEIEIYDKGTSFLLLWEQIIEWKIETDEEGIYYLIIETADKKQKINISWLDKSPDAIEKLLQHYKTK